MYHISFPNRNIQAIDTHTPAVARALHAAIDDLVAANRILAGLGVLDGFGHVSARHPDRSDRYLLARSVAPELVTGNDIMTFDLASNAEDGDTRAPYL